MKKNILLLLFVIGQQLNAQFWNLNGNAGTNASTHFLGTTDNQSLTFKVNNSEKLRITSSGRFVIQGLDGGFGWNNNFFLGGGNEVTSSVGNYSLGIGSMISVTTGNYNNSFGANSLMNLTSGNDNVAVGTNSQTNNLKGNKNVSFGGNSLSGLGIMNENTAIGSGALARYQSTVSDNISGNTAVGMGSLVNLLSGNNNTALGKRAFDGLRNGSDNIAIGYYTADNLFYGSNNIYIGQGVKSSGNSINNELNIGNWIIGNNGTIGIGTFINTLPADGITADGKKYKLFVKDGIRTEKVKVDVSTDNGWADYVLKKDYELMSLIDLEKFIEQNGHLPEIPTTEEAIKNGIELKAMNILLLKKIEELTLHAIQQEKRIRNLEKRK